MRLFEAILDANRRAVAGDLSAGLHVADYAQDLPVAALTCLDPRLNRLFPGVLALPEDQFIWLRNAGNLIAGPLHGPMRSLAMACAINGARELALIGHTDCRAAQTTIGQLTDLFKAIGIERRQLPENMAEYFGAFSSPQQNVIRGVEFIRQSPLIPVKIPVHGLMVNTQSGQLEWVVNGYDALGRVTVAPGSLTLPELGGVVGNLSGGADFNYGDMKFPESKIGDTASAPVQTLFAPKPGAAPAPPPAPTPTPAPSPAPPRLPPPPARPRGALPIPPPIELHPGRRRR